MALYNIAVHKLYRRTEIAAKTAFANPDHSTNGLTENITC